MPAKQIKPYTDVRSPNSAKRDFHAMALTGTLPGAGWRRLNRLSCGQIWLGTSGCLGSLSVSDMQATLSQTALRNGYLQVGEAIAGDDKGAITRGFRRLKATSVQSPQEPYGV